MTTLKVITGNYENSGNEKVSIFEIPKLLNFDLVADFATKIEFEKGVQVSVKERSFSFVVYTNGCICLDVPEVGFWKETVTYIFENQLCVGQIITGENCRLVVKQVKAKTGKKNYGSIVRTYPLYESPNKVKNDNKYGTLSGNQCVCCGAPLPAGSTKMVHMNTNWKAVNIAILEEDVEAETGYESQGWFCIGNDCAKKMPSEFVSDF